jgi:hypothetical protein
MAGGWFVLNVVATIAAVLLIAGLLVLVWRDRLRWTRLEQRVLLVCATLVAAFAAFGIVWNSGEEEFWFQTTLGLAPALAIATGQEGQAGRRVAWAGVFLVLAVNNLVTFALPRRNFPYQQYVNEVLAETTEKDFIIHEGSDEVSSVLFGARRERTVRAISLTGLLEQNGYRVEAALDRLRASIANTRRRGGRVVIIGVLEPALGRHPWTFLEERFGIGSAPFLMALKEWDPVRARRLVGRPTWQLQGPRAPSDP